MGDEAVDGDGALRTDAVGGSSSLRHLRVLHNDAKNAFIIVCSAKEPQKP